MAGRVAKAREGLPEDDREVLLLRQADGPPYEEVAELLGVTPAAARQRYGHALTRLQRILAENGIVGDDA